MRIQIYVSVLMLFALSGYSDKPKIKNILFLVSDDLKASVLNAYGNKICKTPNIDRLAEQGMVFERAYCQGVVCVTSRPSMMLSKYPGSQGGYLSLGRYLRQHDIHSARVGKIFHMPVPHAQLDGSNGHDDKNCWDERFNTKSAETFSPGLYRLLNKNIVTRTIEGRDAKGPNRMYATVESDNKEGSDQADYMCASKAIELLQKRKKSDKPFFLAVGFVRPHFPMVQPKKFFDMYPLEKIELPEQFPDDLKDIPRNGHGSKVDYLDKSEDSRRRMWQAYYGSISFMDEQLGRVLKELKILGLDKNTAVIFTTDHGYHLGEHGFWQKNNLHEEVTRIPLIISVPGIKGGRRSSSIVELVDFYPTCTELFNIKTPKEVLGKSLLPILNDPKASVREDALSMVTLHPQRLRVSLRSSRWAYMCYGKGGEELYDMTKDPKQFINQVNNPEYAPILKEARSKLRSRLESIPFKNRDFLDEIHQ